MKATKKNNSNSKLTGNQLVQKKLDEVNAMLKKMDLSALPGRRPTTKQD